LIVWAKAIGWRIAKHAGPRFGYEKPGGLAQFGKLARRILMFSSATWAINGGHGFSTVGQPAALKGGHLRNR
jgi:hypothetical protein